ncbi:MBL fold metallo-hydrolase [Candidatus Roizmanbacteria bacterium]|nr:MBL fold metallo-hydrolase [Candidatus Roizmanbacteria bacterium]
MAYEIDYLPVGNGESSGDAIILRFGNLLGERKEQTIVVIDGGFKETGEQIIEHIRKYYSTNIVDLVIATHLDRDHISGLYPILENLQVTHLLMHRPWEHAENIKKLFVNKKITQSGLEEKIEKSLQQVVDLEDLALKKKVEIVEPFQGVKGYGMTVLGPSIDYYEKLIPLFDGTPQPIMILEQLMGATKSALESAIEWIDDKFGIDLLNNDEEETSPENNTSAIVLFQIDGHKLLFTGDAGKTALHLAADYADSLGIPLTDLNFMDVPHHGSKHNISSKVLQRMKAPIAYVSASKEAPKHPAKKVTNGLNKIGARVFVTRGSILNFHHDTPVREGWVAAAEEPFYEKVEK